MSRCASSIDVADVLVVIERTVKGCVGGMFAELGAHARAAAIVLA